MDENTVPNSVSTMKMYEIKQVDSNGIEVTESIYVEAQSGEWAAKQLKSIAVETQSIKICLHGKAMSEMDIDYWQKRIRRR